MNKATRSRKSTAKSSARLGAYLATGISASTVAISSSDAAIVQIDIGSTGFNMDGINAGLSSESTANFLQFPASGGGRVTVWNFNSHKGLFGSDGLEFAFTGGIPSPRNFAYNSPIGSSASFSASLSYTFFRTSFYGTAYNSPDFGPGSYMGFRTANNSFGWLEVTWDGTNYEILSGAYETDPGVAILAGQGAAVPEPGTWAAAALLAGGATVMRWRKRRDEAVLIRQAPFTS